VKTDRLEIRLAPEITTRLRSAAARRRTSMGQLVREAIEMLLGEDRQARRQAAEALFRVGAPVGDWPQMEQEIETGRAEEPPGEPGLR
jgi:predicted DNA-binding protein